MKCPFGMAYFQGLLLLVSGRVVSVFVVHLGGFSEIQDFFHQQYHQPKLAIIKNAWVKARYVFAALDLRCLRCYSRQKVPKIFFQMVVWWWFTMVFCNHKHIQALKPTWWWKKNPTWCWKMVKNHPTKTNPSTKALLSSLTELPSNAQKVPRIKTKPGDDES